ncbi:hypothetical protein [Sinorhizobium fredii]|uniref:hypothetical protein n=1 Tax=Rhizobium fredii TaxID=380 RepID=UPI0004B37046|nr:hypothetical protein [Sinorhizobium fredii]ASY70754.1 hypothetical protein SF83666_c33560 [Sinorhizobium fredii CCBAU 83666]
MPRKSKKQRNEEQAVRQQHVRDEAKARCRPSRDDLARVLLWQMITAAQGREDARIALDKLSEAIVGELERQGFAVRECENVFEDLVDRYSDGLFPFRPKRHLTSQSVSSAPSR